jgi:hypothetical protein
MTQRIAVYDNIKAAIKRSPFLLPSSDGTAGQLLCTVGSNQLGWSNGTETGFDFPENVTLSYDSTTRQVTLTGTYNAYWKGVKVAALTNGWVSAAHTNAVANYFLYYDGSSFIWSTTPWTLDLLMIAYVHFGSVDKFGVRECHGQMSWQAHREFHQTTGTYRSSGGTLSNYVLASTTAADRRPDVSAATINDEDLLTVNAALTSKLYTKLFLTGANTVNFTVETADIVPLSGNQPYYNQFTGGVFQQTLMTNNSYMSVWVMETPVDASVASQKYRHVFIQGQSEGTLAAIQSEIPSNLNLGDYTNISTEFIIVAKIILRYTSGNWQLIQIDNVTGTRNNQTTTPTSGSLYLSSVSHDTTLSGDGSVSTPLSIPAHVVTSATIANNQSSAASVTGLLLDGVTYRAAHVKFSIYRTTSTAEVAETGTVFAVYKTVAGTWEAAQSGAGSSGVVLSIANTGQISYTSSNLSGTSYNGTMKWMIDYLPV